MGLKVRLTFRLHHQLFCLHCTLVWLFCRIKNLPSIFTRPHFGLVLDQCQIMPRLHRIMDTCQVRKYPDSTITKVLTGLKWRIITTSNRKLLEKKRVQSHFDSYEVHIGHFFYNIKATVSFGNRLTLYLFRFNNFFTHCTGLTN